MSIYSGKSMSVNPAKVPVCDSEDFIDLLKPCGPYP